MMATGLASTSPKLESTKLNSIIDLHIPVTVATSPQDLTNNDPTTIIVCGWMGANERPISKYISQYNIIYPTARIISIRSLSKVFFTSTSSRLASLSPLPAAIHADPSVNKRVLVHLFSNGGALTLSDISRKMGKLRIQGIVLDSAPGTESIKGGWNAMSVLLPKNPLAWYPAAAGLCLALLISWITSNIFRATSAIQRIREFLNDKNLVDGKAKRLYVYSDSDLLVSSKDVENHMRDAEAKGISVQRWKVVGSAHVSHMVKDPEGYWKTIKEFWASAFQM